MNTKVPLKILCTGLISSILSITLLTQQVLANKFSTNETGIIGLNTIPSARMDKAGTIRLGTGTSDPYLHGFLGFQITESTYASIRQTAEISSLSDPANRVYPGVDLKFKLLDETNLRPQIALGLDSAFGHKKIASEYLAFSKQYNNFDFTAGVAWGRLGSSGHFKNPLKGVSSHFGKDRQYNNESSQSFNDWFTGEDIGLFGGMEYFTPIKGLSLKADYGANDYLSTENITNFDRPSPWSVGFNFQPWKYTDLSAAVIGGDKVMARLSLQGGVQKWIGQDAQSDYTPKIETTENNATILHLSSGAPTAHEIGRAVGQGEQTENTSIYLQHSGLKGPNLTLLGKDIALIKNNQQNTSPDEIWHNSRLKNQQTTRGKKQPSDFRVFLDTKLSLAEDEAGPLYRSALIAKYERPTFLGFHLGMEGRLNLLNNLDNLSLIQSVKNNKLNIRENEQEFANRRLSLDRFYTNWRSNLTNNLYASASIGYLEEMFSGYGGEILYRPFGKTFAIGAEAWRVNKRDPFTDFNLGATGEDYTTAHLNVFYEVPNKNITAYGNIGRYLGEDFGATAGLKTLFKNGATIDGFITATNEEDIDIFGGSSSLYSGVRLSLPIGNIPYISNNSAARFEVSPFGRNFGQKLNKPIDLYEATEPFSSRQIHQSWPTLLN